MRVKLDWDEPELEPEPVCERCEAPQSWCQCLPILTCATCGEESEDIWGFGILFYCEDCKACLCANVVNGRCTACGKVSYAA